MDDINVTKENAMTKENEVKLIELARELKDELTHWDDDYNVLVDVDKEEPAVYILNSNRVMAVVDMRVDVKIPFSYNSVTANIISAITNLWD